MNSLDGRSYFFDEGPALPMLKVLRLLHRRPRRGGVVRASPKEIADMAVYLDMAPSRAIDAFLSPWENGHRIKEDGHGRCLFFENGCRVCPVRPDQGRTFPFWFSNLRSEARWESIRRQCPDIGTDRRYAKNEILDILAHSM